MRTRSSHGAKLRFPELDIRSITAVRQLIIQMGTVGGDMIVVGPGGNKILLDRYPFTSISHEGFNTKTP